MRPNPLETADLATFTKEILNGKFHFFMQCHSQLWLTQLTGAASSSIKIFLEVINNNFERNFV